ncbi:hypothetical protein BHC51_04055 [Snodgrassella alvi]|nr:hypothetical protein BHC51_04055 [Snodgrassella alvi]
MLSNIVDENIKRDRDREIYVGESHECVVAVKHFSKAKQITIWKKEPELKVIIVFSLVPQWRRLIVEANIMAMLQYIYQSNSKGYQRL